jgi:tetratricopeptide (TPR) repeat protein
MAMVAGAAFVLTSRQPIKPPSISTVGLDPAVAKRIEQTVAEVREAPRSGAAWGKLGSVLMHYEFVEQANDAFAHAEALAPTEPRWPYLHGLLLLNHDVPAAGAKLNLAARLSGNTPDMPRLRLAQFLAEQGRDQEAEHHFKALLSSQPAHTPALLGLARVYQMRGDLTNCTNTLRGCLEDRHTAKSAYALLAVTYRALGLAPEAAAAARRSAVLPPDAPWPDPFWDEAAAWRTGRKAKIEDASALMDRGQFDAALPILTQLGREYPDDEEVWYLMGWALNQLQQSSAAEEALREHLRRAPQSPKGHAQLAVSLLQQKRYSEAIDVLNAGLKLKPTWREFHSNLGFASVQLGRDGDAVRHFRNALECDPGYPPTYTALAELLSRDGKGEEARRLLLQVLKLDPGNGRAEVLLERLRP